MKCHLIPTSISKIIVYFPHVSKKCYSLLIIATKCTWFYSFCSLLNIATKRMKKSKLPFRLRKLCDSLLNFITQCTWKISFKSLFKITTQRMREKIILYHHFAKNVLIAIKFHISVTINSSFKSLFRVTTQRMRTSTRELILITRREKSCRLVPIASL